MKLIEFMNNFKMVNKETLDNVFNVFVSIEWFRDWNNETENPYFVFCKKLFERVEFKEVIENETWVVCWSELVLNNLELFRKFAHKWWDEKSANIIDNSDPYDFVCSWIEHFNYYLDNQGSDDDYRNLIVLLEECKGVKLDNDKKYLKSMMRIIGNLNNKKELNKAICEFASILCEDGKLELAEYCLAQIGIGAWVIDDGK